MNPTHPPSDRTPTLRLRRPADLDHVATEIWGQPEETIALAGRLTRAGFVPADPDEPPASPPHRAFVATPDATPAPVYARALASLQQQAHASAQPAPALLHPVARAVWLDLPDTGRFLVTGYSGHGNMLVQTLLRALDEHTLGPDEHRPRPTWIQRLRHDADLHGHVLRAASEALLASVAQACDTELRDYVVAPHRFDDCEVRARFTDDRVLLIRGLTYAGFLAADFGSHAPWDDTAQRFAQRFGYRRIYAVVRDPLAGLASNAAKTARPHEAALHRADWFAHCAKDSADYLAALHRRRDNVQLIVFEDLLREPIAHLHRFAQDAGYALTDAQANGIWNRIGFRPVTDAGADHFVDPLADKRRHFRKAHLPLLEASGLMPWFDAFGYATPTADDLPDGPLEPPASDATPNPLYGRPDPTRLHTLTLTDPALDILATDAPLADRAAELAAQPAFAAVAQCLGRGLLGEASRSR